MDITVIIQVAIGIVFVWVFLSVITSQIQEWFASILQWRGFMLENTIAQMLSDPTLKDKVYNHPLIQALHTSNGTRRPSGIPADKFALVLFEEVMNSGVDVGKVKDTFDKLKKNVAAIKDSSTDNDHLKNFAKSLDTLLLGIEDKANDATDAFAEARQRVEGWFDNAMERLGGAYKRRIQIVGIIVGIGVAAFLNVDTAAIATTLWNDPEARGTIVSEAGQITESDITVETGVITTEALDELPLPIGWSQPNIPTDLGGWLRKGLGIFISGMAAAQGAPYWFDLMRKLLSRDQGSNDSK